jgi:hypothetical protein
MDMFEPEEETVAFSGAWLDHLAREARRSDRPPPASTEISEALLAEMTNADVPKTLPAKPAFSLTPPPLDLTDEAELLSEASIIRQFPERVSEALFESVRSPLESPSDPYVDLAPRSGPGVSVAPVSEPRTTTLLMLAGAIGFLTKAALVWSIVATALMLSR